MNVPFDASGAHGAGNDAGLSVALLEAALAGVVVVNSSRQVVAITPLAEKLTGLAAAAVLGQSSSVLPPALQAVIDETFVNGTRISRRAVALKDDSSSLSSVSTTPSRTSSGVLSVTAEIQDLGAARAMALNLEHLDRLAGLGVVTAGVAHEIKNALVAVRTFFDLLAGGENDEDLRAVAGSEVHRIERTVRHLLRGARREEFHMASLSIHALLQDALNLARHELQTKSITMITMLNAPQDRINGDERQLRHTFINLLINAAEAMSPGGRLTLSTQVVEAWERKHIRVTVADTGTGISAEQMARLFSPFFTTKPDGTGLGLAISRRIVNAHNGAITVESQPGKGTSFHVFLPLLES